MMEADQNKLLQEKLHAIKESISELWKIAKSDNKVTDEERRLLETIESSIKNYESKLDQILK